ncbi:hypothetical protein AVMA1855_15230 [Acidovorax sp. SUPP1855]|uniref:hypothetical protein n=1 Tax=unclassified Acidovorax TaxID=2684926 RepID=UPI0023DE5B0F|nr:MULTISPECIES: hypothetical protein [unclassified Acidovorax]GKS85520.1 hypothetical protein AVMA1855_15230 [Acidovorax sp. SUPP1855]GKT00418.1 hypothetical protein AVKW3434_13535 [Acidovorax sp. SUPP3434]
MWEEPVGKLADLRQVCMPDAPDDVQGANPALLPQQVHQAHEARVQMSHSDAPSRQFS